HWIFTRGLPLVSCTASICSDARRPTGAVAFVLFLSFFTGLALAGCSKSETAQAHGRDEAAKPVKTEPVRQETVRRSVEVVGTLAAVDEATVSSEADGVVSRILADLGDRVSAGQVMVELDREKAEYNVAQQRAAVARDLAKYGASAPDHRPPVDQTTDVQKAA